MPLLVRDLEIAVRKLGNLKMYMPGQSKEVYGIGWHVGKQLADVREPLQPNDYYRVAMNCQRGDHRAPTEDEMLAIARVVLPRSVVEELETYMAERSASTRPPPS